MIVKDQNKRPSSKEIFEKLKVNIKFILNPVEKIFKESAFLNVLLVLKYCCLFPKKKLSRNVSHFLKTKNF
jgi:hypothetical protein